MSNFIVGTASNSSYFIQLQQMLYSLHILLPNGTTVLILDNGLKSSQIKILNKHFGFLNIKIIKRELTPYERTSYLFKTFIHEVVLKEYSNHIYLWLDTKTNLKYDNEKIEGMLEHQSVYSHSPFSQAESLWTDLRTMNLIGLDEVSRETPQFQASAMMFDLRNEKGRDFLEQLIKLNYQKDIITPEGTTKGNNPPTHRQDQSVFSCLLKKFGYTRNPSLWAICHQTIF